VLEVAAHAPAGMLAKMRPLCGKCNVEVDPFKAQLKSKAAGRFICNVCNTKSVMFHRTLGAWPVPEFKELSEADQLSFWNEARGKKNGEQLKSLLIDTLVTKRVDKVTARVAGTYLPLTVYKTQGFDVDLISSKCTDTQEHPILGTTYRVALSSLSRESVEEKQRVQVMEMLKAFKDASSKAPEALSKGMRTSSSGAARLADRLDEAIDEDESSDDDSADSSSSSSSSSDKKKKKKDKKKKDNKKKRTKKDSKKDKDDPNSKKKKAPAKKKKTSDDERREKAEKKVKLEYKKIKTECTKIMAKVAHPIFALEEVLADKMCSKVASFAVDACKKSIGTLKKLRSEATAKQKTDEPKPISTSMESISEECKAALSNLAILQNMIVTATAHFKGS